MSDQETNQLLREILAAQKELSAMLRQSERAFEENTKLYRESDAFYREQLATKPWERAVRFVTLLGVVMLLGYIILR